MQLDLMRCTWRLLGHLVTTLYWLASCYFNQLVWPLNANYLKEVHGPDTYLLECRETWQKLASDQEKLFPWGIFRKEILFAKWLVISQVQLKYYHNYFTFSSGMTWFEIYVLHHWLVRNQRLNFIRKKLILSDCIVVMKIKHNLV